MSKESPFHGQAVNATGFLGGITFATMILLLENDTLQYKEWLITATAIVSVLFIISTLGMMRIAAGVINKNNIFTKYIELIAGGGFLGLMAILPAVVWQFNITGAIIILIVEGIVMYIFVKYIQQ